MGKSFTAEEIAANKNVVKDQVVAVFQAKPEDIEQFTGGKLAIVKDGDEYIWTFSVDGVVQVTSRKFETDDEAKQHCRRLTGIAWNFAVEMER